MLIVFNRDDGFKLEVPYSRWLIGCAGTAMLVNAVRWW